MALITIIISLILAAGWLATEYNFRSVKAKNSLLRDRQQRLERQVEQLHVLLQTENEKVEELQELSAEAAEYREKYLKTESDLKRYENEVRRMEQTFVALRQRASSKEYFGSALGKLVVASIDKLLSPQKEESEKLSESARDVFRKAKRAIND
ncbi:MAG: hypothetical protein OEX19_02110 [Gammaproteobacteria bacterium]|nr:hypothetical protein [Gammaproteobacteria bacterium]